MWLTLPPDPLVGRGALPPAVVRALRVALFLLACSLLVGCPPAPGVSGGGVAMASASQSQPSIGQTQPGPASSRPARGADAAGTALAGPPPPGLSVATFAGGCFWCMEGPFEALEGVVDAISGYTGGPEPAPRYADVARGRTGHTEAVQVIFDPTRITYAALLDVYWRQIDPSDGGGQFADRGPQYRPVIFVHDDAQRAAAEASRAAMEASGRFRAPIVVPIEDAAAFWIAEDEHQNYYRTNPTHYQRYRRGSGREGFLRRTWGD